VPTSKSRRVAHQRREARNRQLAAVEERLLSIFDELFGRAWQFGKLLPRHKDRVGDGKWIIWLPDGNSGTRVRLRISKTSIPKHRFSFQKSYCSPPGEKWENGDPNISATRDNATEGRSNSACGNRVAF
jgi:hypothetical protein